MIIWSGLGFLVPLIAFGACLLLNFVLDARFGKGYYSAHDWAMGTALILGGLLSFAVGLLLRPRPVGLPGGVYSQRPVRGHRHTFFFIPMHWAGLIIAVIGVGVMVYGFVK